MALTVALGNLTSCCPDRPKTCAAGRRSSKGDPAESSLQIGLSTRTG